MVGPSSPSTCNTRVDNSVYSQSSINSHRCDKPTTYQMLVSRLRERERTLYIPVSLASGIVLMIVKMASTIERLYSRPPSSRRLDERKFINDRCFLGNYTTRSIQYHSLTLTQFLFGTYLDAQSFDSINNYDLKVVGNLTHKAVDLLHQSVDTAFASSLTYIVHALRVSMTDNRP